MHGIVNGTTNFILTEMARTGATFGDALAEAQRLGYAEADPSEDVDGRDAAAKMAILARLAFDTPVHLDQVRYEGIEHIQPDDLEYARELGLELKLIGTAERIGEGLSVRVHPVFLYPAIRSRRSGPFNAVTVESEAITEITMSGPGAGGPQTASAVLGDVISAMIPPASTPPTSQQLKIVEDVVSSFYLHLEVADEPGVLAQVARVLAAEDVSVKSVVQKGLGDQARLVMVLHPVLESRFGAAVAEIERLDILRAPPRAIRVLEEEFGRQRATTLAAAGSRKNRMRADARDPDRRSDRARRGAAGGRRARARAVPHADPRQRCGGRRQGRGGVVPRGAPDARPVPVQAALPFVPGSEVGGIVRSAPDGAPVTPGDRVAAFCMLGGFAEVVGGARAHDVQARPTSSTSRRARRSCSITTRRTSP